MQKEGALTTFRGFNAAASLKHAAAGHVSGHGGAFRGFNAAASLKLRVDAGEGVIESLLPRF